MAHTWNLASDCKAFHTLNVEIRDYANYFKYNHQIIIVRLKRIN